MPCSFVLSLRLQKNFNQNKRVNTAMKKTSLNKTLLKNVTKKVSPNNIEALNLVDQMQEQDAKEILLIFRKIELRKYLCKNLLSSI